MITIIALILVTLGAINWLAVGIFDFNIVNWIFTPSAYVGASCIRNRGNRRNMAYSIFDLQQILTEAYSCGRRYGTP